MAAAADEVMMNTPRKSLMGVLAYSLLSEHLLLSPWLRRRAARQPSPIPLQARCRGESPSTVKLPETFTRFPVFDTFTIVNADGSNERNLTQGRGGFDPVWSPDGLRLAFVRAGGVWTMNGEGRNERRRTPNLRGQFPELVS